MNDFIATYCHKNDKKINRDMFERAYDKPIHEYLVDTCRNLEVIPGLKLESWELITDQTKIEAKVNKRNAKDPKIKNNRTLEQLVQPNKTLYDILELNFRIQIKNYDIPITRRVRVLKAVGTGLYIRNGRKVRILNQVVDNSTFVKQNILNFKTKLYAIKLSTTRVKLEFIDGDVLNCSCFMLDLLSKTINPMAYFLANYTIPDLLEMFDLDKLVSVVDNPLDEAHYLYLRVATNVYIEVNEGAFLKHPFIATFVASLYDYMKANGDGMTLKDAYNQEYWLECLSEIFSKKRYVNKALRVLVSFNKIVDVGVQKQFIIAKHHKRNTFTILRWMMTNYGELLKKDSHDLRNKRVRANETLAYFFDKHVTKNVYSLLNTDNPSIDKYRKLLNSINELTLLRGVHGGSGSSPTSMFRYERYNSFDAIEKSRYTLKGPTGLNGGKNGVSDKYRDIYPSQIGRYDINVCSSSDPGLTGYLCANVQLDKSGYFDADFHEPDEYEDVIEDIIDKYAESKYKKKRSEYIDMQLSRDDDGFIHLKRKYQPGPDSWIQKDFIANPSLYGMFRTADGLRLKPNPEALDNKGFIKLVRQKPSKLMAQEELKRDADGFIVLERVETKMDRFKAK